VKKWSCWHKRSETIRIESMSFDFIIEAPRWQGNAPCAAAGRVASRPWHYCIILHLHRAHCGIPGLVGADDMAVARCPPPKGPPATSGENKFKFTRSDRNLHPPLNLHVSSSFLQLRILGVIQLWALGTRGPPQATFKWLNLGRLVV
jgi:hypothetical protein